jgi:hypothetical protein
LWAVFPATAVLGVLLCLFAIVPAIFAFRRVRKGTATNRRLSLAALVVAPRVLHRGRQCRRSYGASTHHH